MLIAIVDFIVAPENCKAALAAILAEAPAVRAMKGTSPSRPILIRRTRWRGRLYGLSAARGLMRWLLSFIGRQQPPSGGRRLRHWITPALPHGSRRWPTVKVTVAASNPNEGCQFVGRPFRERSSQMVEKGGNAGVQEAP
jgi:hypothetical protein